MSCLHVMMTYSLCMLEIVHLRPCFSMRSYNWLLFLERVYNTLPPRFLGENCMALRFTICCKSIVGHYGAMHWNRLPHSCDLLIGLWCHISAHWLVLVLSFTFRMKRHYWIERHVEIKSEKRSVLLFRDELAKESRNEILEPDMRVKTVLFPCQ